MIGLQSNGTAMEVSQSRPPLRSHWRTAKSASRKPSPFSSTSSPCRVCEAPRSEARRRQVERLNAVGKTNVVLAESDAPSLQLATAKLPQQIDTEKFAINMYQWAATLTSSGQNLPFTLPLKTQKLSNGFKFSLLRISNGEPVPVAHISAEVEEEPNIGNVFFVRFYEGEGSQLIRSTKLPNDPQERLKVIIDGLVDVTTIMRTMKAAIKETAGRSRKQQ